MTDLLTQIHAGHLAVDIVSLSVALTTFAMAVGVAVGLDRRAAAKASDDERAVR